MRNNKKIKFKLKKTRIIDFSYFPIIVYDNSYVTIKWNIKHALFVRINNKIGFRKSKGEYFTLIKKGTKYKLTAFRFFGIERFELIPEIKNIEKKEIKANRYNNELKEIKTKEKLSIVKQSKPILNTIREKYLKTNKTELLIETSTIENQIKEIQYTETYNQIDKLKNKYYV
jgi:hypothetical protein